jgi:branched-subunit amino acid transport protein
MNIWLVMLIGGALTYLTRLSFIWLFERMAVPQLLQRGLRFVPPAVLSVIIFQELLILVAWRTRSALLTIAVGMAALLALNALFSL